MRVRVRVRVKRQCKEDAVRYVQGMNGFGYRGPPRMLGSLSGLQCRIAFDITIATRIWCWDASTGKQAREKNRSHERLRSRTMFVCSPDNALRGPFRVVGHWLVCDHGFVCLLR